MAGFDSGVATEQAGTATPSLLESGFGTPFAGNPCAQKPVVPDLAGC